MTNPPRRSQSMASKQEHFKSQEVYNSETKSPPFLFAIQMNSLCKMSELQRETCGVKLSTENILPTGSYFADDSFLIAKSDAAVGKLYQTADE